MQTNLTQVLKFLNEFSRGKKSLYAQTISRDSLILLLPCYNSHY